MLQNKTFNDILASMAATFVAEVATIPICTVKTNYQNTESKSMMSTIKSLYQRNGIKSFYAASPAAIGSQMLSTSTKYCFYQYLSNKQLMGGHAILNGVASGLMSSLITHPMDVVKIHWQMGTSMRSKLKETGVKLFYQGYSKTVSKNCVASALFFPLNDYFNNNHQLGVIASSGASAVVSTIVMHPIDYLKTRHIYGQPYWNGLNPLVYYKGLSLNLARIVPHFVIVMTTIDALSYR
jgi:hypothetical protein